MKLTNESKYDSLNKGYGVLTIYTGGTIGSMPKDPDDPDSPQVVVEWQKFKKLSPQLNEGTLGFNVDAYSTEALDSCNIGPKEWVEMATVISENYTKYEGFVILHGTDTMVYTASALSFMLQNLTKPVVLTGAQMAYLFNTRNDGYQNMISALMIANPKFSKIPVIPEVCICFGGKLLRGNRAKKVNASGFDAYTTPNYKPLTILGESLQIDTSLLRKPDPNKVLLFKPKLNPNVVAVNFFPGIQDGKILENILKDTTLKGVVLMAYGAGNIPTKENVLNLIDNANKRGVVFLNVTQCGGGKVELGMYDTSAKLIDVGVVSGVDITSEAALVKLMVILGDEDLNSHQLALEAQKDIAGEQSLSIYTTEFPGNAVSIDNNNKRHRLAATIIDGYDAIKDGKVERILLRFRNGVFNGPEDRIDVKLFIDISSDEPLNENSPNYLGEYKKLPNSNPTVAFFDITERAKKVIGNRASFTIVLNSENSSFKWESTELTIFAHS